MIYIKTIIAIYKFKNLFSGFSGKIKSVASIPFILTSILLISNQGFIFANTCTTTVLNEPFSTSTITGANGAVLYGNGGSDHNATYPLSGTFFGWFNIQNGIGNVDVYDRYLTGLSVGCTVDASIWIRESYGSTDVTLSLVDDFGTTLTSTNLILTGTYQLITLSNIITTPGLHYVIHFNGIGGNGLDIVTEDLLITQSCNVVADIAPIANQCFNGNNFFFDGTGSNATLPITSYTWDYGDGTALGSGASPNHTYGSAAIYTVELIVTDGACSDTTTLNIDVFTAPDITTTNINSNCGVSSADITSSFVDNNATGGTVSYWQNSAATIVEPNPTNITLAGTYYIVIDAAGCNDTASVDVTFQASSIIDLGNDIAFCTSVSLLLDAGAGFNNYLWSDASTNQTLNINTAGTYWVQAFTIGANLVVNGDFESGNTGFTTDYTVGLGGAWGPVSNPGTYLITTNPNIAHTNFLNCGDHTTGFGNMMVVNGASIVNQNVWCQTIPVSPNTDYEFSTWIQNYDLSAPAMLAFYINGVQIGSTFSPTTQGCPWQNFFETWNSGVATSAQICIVNNSVAGAGNDFALDDISFSPICISTDTIIVTNSPGPVAVVPANIAYCPGDPVPAGIFTSVPVGATFSWTNTDPSIGLGASGTGNAPNFNAINASASSVVSTILVTPTLNGCIGIPVNYTVTVNALPTATIPLNTIYCAGDLIPISAYNSTPIGATFTWTNSDPSIGLATSGTGNTPAFTGLNATAAAITSTITITPTLNGCVGLPINYTITVNPVATVAVPINATFCSGALVPLSLFTSIPAGATFDWVNSDPTIGLAAAGTGDILAFNIINVSNSSITATITVTPSLNGCPGIPINYSITVNPYPTVNVANVSYCDGDLVSSSAFTSVPSGGTFIWTNSDPSIGLASSGNGNTPSYTASNNTGSTLTATVAVTPTFNGCVGVPTNYTITIFAPISIPNVITNITCFGDNNGQIEVSPTGGTPAYNYSWTAAGIGNTALAANLPGGSVTVTVTDINGCSEDSTFTIIEPSQINYVLFNATPKSGCSPLNVEFYNLTDTNLISTLTWDLGNGTVGSGSIQNFDTLTTTYLTPGTYDVSLSVTDKNGCPGDLSQTNYITVHEDPVADFSFLPDYTTMFDPTIYFTDLSQFNIVDWNWDFSGLGTSSDQHPNFIFPEDTGNYQVTLIVQDANGCFDTETKMVRIYGEYGIYLPNSFTPDQNGINDEFSPKGFGISEQGYLFSIYNRWGELLFESQSLIKGWDGTYKGKLIPNDTYVWKLNFTDLDRGQHQRTGHVNVLR